MSESKSTNGAIAQRIETNNTGLGQKNFANIEWRQKMKLKLNLAGGAEVMNQINNDLFNDFCSKFDIDNLSENDKLKMSQGGNYFSLFRSLLEFLK